MQNSQSRGILGLIIILGVIFLITVGLYLLLGGFGIGNGNPAFFGAASLALGIIMSKFT